MLAANDVMAAVVKANGSWQCVSWQPLISAWRVCLVAFLNVMAMACSMASAYQLWLYVINNGWKLASMGENNGGFNAG